MGYPEATQAYSRAFRLWGALDSPEADNGVPAEVMVAARAAGCVTELPTIAPYLSGSLAAMESLAPQGGLPQSAFEDFMLQGLTNLERPNATAATSDPTTA